MNEEHCKQFYKNDSINPITKRKIQKGKATYNKIVSDCEALGVKRSAPRAAPKTPSPKKKAPSPKPKSRTPSPKKKAPSPKPKSRTPSPGPKTPLQKRVLKKPMKKKFKPRTPSPKKKVPSPKPRTPSPKKPRFEPPWGSPSQEDVKGFSPPKRKSPTPKKKISSPKSRAPSPKKPRFEPPGQEDVKGFSPPKRKSSTPKQRVPHFSEAPRSISPSIKITRKVSSGDYAPSPVKHRYLKNMQKGDQFLEVKIDPIDIRFSYDPNEEYPAREKIVGGKPTKLKRLAAGALPYYAFNDARAEYTYRLDLSDYTKFVDLFIKIMENNVASSGEVLGTLTIIQLTADNVLKELLSNNKSYSIKVERVQNPFDDMKYHFMYVAKADDQGYIAGVRAEWFLKLLSLINKTLLVGMILPLNFNLNMFKIPFGTDRVSDFDLNISYRITKNCILAVALFLR